MTTLAQTLSFFRPWFVEPLAVRDDASVIEVMRAINAHPVAHDDTAQDYFMPPRRFREAEGRFRVWGENQDNFYCFVKEGAETETDPPVYFEACLDLVQDHGFAPNEVFDGNYVLLCETFPAFLWFALAHQITLRLELPAGLYTSDVNGFIFGRDSRGITLGSAFMNPLGRQFPAGYTCWIGEDTICIPDWGAAFLNSNARERFLLAYDPTIGDTWRPL